MTLISSLKEVIVWRLVSKTRLAWRQVVRGEDHSWSFPRRTPCLHHSENRHPSTIEYLNFSSTGYVIQRRRCLFILVTIAQRQDVGSCLYSYFWHQLVCFLSLSSCWMGLGFLTTCFNSGFCWSLAVFLFFSSCSNDGGCGAAPCWEYWEERVIEEGSASISSQYVAKDVKMITH